MIEWPIDWDPESGVQPGFFRTPTVRENGKGDGSVDPALVKAYGHNGYFKSLEGIINFYNTRDTKPRCEFVPIEERRTSGGEEVANYDVVDPPIVDATEAEALAAGCWPEPEFPETASTFGGVGDLGLSAEEEAALVAYIRALTDNHIADREEPAFP